jgi:hypothetical protein
VCKKILFFAAIALIFFGSCQTRPIVWDSTFSEAESATVHFRNMVVTNYNGISVSKFSNVMIPGGQTNITADVAILHAGRQFNARGMEFSYNFQAGREYKVSGGTQDMRWGVLVFEGNEHLAFLPLPMLESGM